MKLRREEFKIYKCQNKIITSYNSLTRVCFHYNYNYRYENETNMTTKEEQIEASCGKSVRYVSRA